MALDLIIDANVFKSYYDYLILSKESLLTSCPSGVFNNIGINKTCFFDEGGIIKHEWENLVDRQWFDAWYGEKLALAHIELTTTLRDPSLESQLASHGFPRSRDLTYVRVCRQVIERSQECWFITEDLDFYDPTQKNAHHKTRRRILLKGQGNVRKCLKKKNIFVKCVANCD